MTVSSTQVHVDLTGEGGRKFWITLYVKNHRFWLKINVQMYSRVLEAITLDFLHIFIRLVALSEVTVGYIQYVM